MIKALLPPNSKTHFFKCFPASVATAIPACSLPVKETALMIGFAITAATSLLGIGKF